MIPQFSVHLAVGFAAKDSKLIIYSHPEYQNHQVTAGHAECPERLNHLLEHWDNIGLSQDLNFATPSEASPARLLAVHPKAHLDFIQQMSPEEGVVPLDPDTWLGPKSRNAAILAAGALCSGVDAVLANEDSRVFCAVRPPGHHAEIDSAMGFCIFNSVAIGAVAALEHPEIERVAILDFDVHHGNGTVDIFKDSPEVLVCSSFQHPFYPNRHADTDRANIVNTPLSEGSNGSDFRRAIETSWLPALEQHKPDLIFVSAGFDAHQLDPLAGLNLLEEDFIWITNLITATANQYSQGRVISTLEGGYHLDALANSATAHILALSN
jgi:acetoin utilization deacetylase AcuC-like enzyme